MSSARTNRDRAPARVAGKPPKRIGVLEDARVAAALEGLDVAVDLFHDVDALIQQGRQLQPRVCVLGAAAGAEEVARITRQVRGNLPFTDVIVWGPEASPGLVQSALRAGAREVALDPSLERLSRLVRKTLEEQTLLPAMLEREQREGGTWRFEGLVSRSRKMWNIFETCIRTAETDASVLILGETGTGKDLIARAIHRRSKRTGNYVALNCGAVPDTLIDSELFGHVKGAFTGAHQAKEGLFRHADGGTLFLDEIGSIPLGAQNSLLRVLQSHEVRPVGGHEEVPVDVRVIAATSAPLEEEIAEHRFREDLFYRLDVIRLIVPPLRERPEDVIFLLGMFAQQLAQDYQLPRPEITESFLDAVLHYAWPGNVRELENFVERLTLSHAGERLEAEHFEALTRTYRGREEEPEAERGRPGIGPASGAARADGAPSGETADLARVHGTVVDIDRPLPELLEDAGRDVEHAYLVELLTATRGRVGRAAEKAGIHRRTLLRKLRRHGIDKAEFRE